MIVWSLAAWMVLVAAALAVRAVQQAPPKPAARTLAASDPDLARCRAAGEAASADQSCQAAWAKARARFLGRSAP